MAEFASYSLELLSPLHLGSRRAGVVAHTHRFAPGHLFSFALAAALGGRRNGSPAAFADALEEVLRRFRFGPAFFLEAGHRLLDAEVEERLLSSSHHVTLAVETRAAMDSALFEVEQLQASAGSAIRLAGGVWYDRDNLDGRSLRNWLSDILLGGELKTGCGRVRCSEWQAGTKNYPGIGPADAKGLRLDIGTLLPGPTLGGVADAPLSPWLGRRHDPQRGFGRQLSQACLVRIDGRVAHSGRFLPYDADPGLGCWHPDS